MTKRTESDLVDLTLILEEFKRDIKTMTLKQQIDLAARIQPAGKHIESILEFVKDAVRDKCGHKDGSVTGHQFVGKVHLVPVNRFQQKMFKEARPALYEQFVREDTDERVTFELR